MKTKRIISAVLATAVLAAGTITSAFTASAATAVEEWDIMTQASADMANRSEYNYIEGTITTNKGLNDHFIWGMNLTKELPAGTYFMNFEYKVLGKDTATSKEDEEKIGFWEIPDAGVSGRFDPPAANDVWTQASMEFTTNATTAAGKEIRFKNLWSGGDFQIVMKKTVTLTTEPVTGDPGDGESQATVSKAAESQAAAESKAAESALAAADKTDLNELIASVEQLTKDVKYDNTKGNYPLIIKAPMEDALAAAKAVSAKADATQDEVDDAEGKLAKQRFIFGIAKITNITKHEATSTEITNLQEGYTIDMKKIEDAKAIEEIKTALGEMAAKITGVSYDLKLALDIAIMEDGKAIEIETDNENIYQVSIPLSAIKDKYGVELDAEGSYVVACCDGEHNEKLETMISGGKLYFLTTHFSEFTIAEISAVGQTSTVASTPAASNAAGTSGTASKSSSPKTGDNNFAPVMVVALLLAGAAVAVVVKKNANKA